LPSGEAAAAAAAGRDTSASLPDRRTAAWPLAVGEAVAATAVGAKVGEATGCALACLPDRRTAEQPFPDGDAAAAATGEVIGEAERTAATVRDGLA
jgi:hypothetical protein